MTDDKKQVLQVVIDNLLYIEEYKEKLIQFNEQFDAHKKVKFNKNINEFLFPLHKAI